MGRGGGGSSGGGGRSSGGGGGRSFGGSSSHSSRGGGSYSRSYSSSRSYSRSYSPGPRVTHHYHYGPSYGYGYSRSSVRLVSVVTVFIVTVVILMTFATVYGTVNGGAGVSKSTVVREPLKPYASFNKWAFDDDAGWVYDPKPLQNGMESFYKQTGIQPALAIYESINGQRYLSNSEIEAFMNEEYDKLIGHERGLLLLFCEYADSDWYAYYMAGEDAQTVMDSEATDILMDYVHALYTNSSYSDEEFFGAVFANTADRIMTVTPTVATRIPMIVVGVVIIALFVVGLKAMKEKNRRAAEKAKETETLLNTPIERL